MKGVNIATLTTKPADWVKCLPCKIMVNIGKIPEYWCPLCRRKLRDPSGRVDDEGRR